MTAWFYWLCLVIFFVVHDYMQKSTYANQIQIRSSKETVKEIDGDIQLCGPIHSLVSRIQAMVYFQGDVQ
jgi:hypothetical protein